MDTLEIIVKWVVLIGFAALVTVMAASFFSGCEHGSNIPIDPFDVCAVEGVEECCPECISETDIILRERHAYRTGFRDGVDSVVCETTDPVCEDDIDDDCEDDAHKKVHKRCKGNGHK